MGGKVLELPAVEVTQGSHQLYSFAVDGKVLSQFASVSRVRRDDAEGLTGYQRPEVLSHISGIRKYIESEDAMLPNAIVVAFDSSVAFEPVRSGVDAGYSRLGLLTIPLADPETDDLPAGWIVDGQQRAAAIRNANVENFPICVTAFITEDSAEQRSQFILVNSTKPLPKSLIYELLPTTDAKLPEALERRRLPAYLLERLNFNPDSPFAGKVQMPTAPMGTIKDNSVLKMLESSISDGALCRFRGMGSDGHEMMLETLGNYWSAVAAVFPEAWSLPPRRSRLIHGAGIVSMGFVMDAIDERTRGPEITQLNVFESDLRQLAPVCHWTAGQWDFGHSLIRAWDDLQNTPRDVQLLANHLLHAYRTVVLKRSA